MSLPQVYPSIVIGGGGQFRGPSTGGAIGQALVMVDPVNRITEWQNLSGVGEANTQTNQGAGVGLAMAKSGIDLPLRSLISGDGSVTFQENADTIDIRSLGGGGGEANRGENAGSGVVQLYAGMNGVNIKIKTLNLANGLSFTDVAETIGLGFDLDYQPLGAGVGLIDFQVSPGNALKVKSLTSADSSVLFSSDTNEVDLSVTAASVGADPAGSAAAVQGNLDTHTQNQDIHFPDAPDDGSDYVRQSFNWVAKTIGDVFSPMGNISGADRIALFDFTEPSGILLKDSGVQLLTAGSGTLFLADDGTYKSAAAGGGEANTQTNLGGFAELGLAKNGVDLPLRTIRSSNSSVAISQGAQDLDFTASAASVGADPAGTASAVQANLDTHTGQTNNPHATTFQILPDTPANFTGAAGFLVRVNATPDGVDFVDGATLFDPAGTASAEVAAHAAIVNGVHGLDNTGDGTLYLSNDGSYTKPPTKLEDDTAPRLGGDLQTKGKPIFFTRSDDSFQGGIAAMESVLGSAFFYTVDGSVFDTDDGAVTVEPGLVTVYGTSARLPGLAHSVNGGRQVYVSESGTLFGVDPPPPGWFVSDTDIGVYARLGFAVGEWQQLTGLVVTAPQDHSPGNPLDVAAEVQVTNGTTNRSGVIEIGFGVNGAEPTVGGNSFVIPEAFDGPCNLSIRTTTATLTTGDTVSIWVRVTSESNGQFSSNLDFDGSGTLAHEMSMGIPGSVGGGSGDVTGPASSVAGNLPSFLDTSGKVIADSGVASSEVITGDGTVAKVVAIGRAAYDALSPPDALTMYLINGP